MRLAAGLCPDPLGSYSAPIPPIAVIDEGREGDGEEGEEGEGKRGMGRGREGGKERGREGALESPQKVWLRPWGCRRCV